MNPDHIFLLAPAFVLVLRIIKALLNMRQPKPEPKPWKPVSHPIMVVDRNGDILDSTEQVIRLLEKQSKKKN